MYMRFSWNHLRRSDVKIYTYMHTYTHKPQHRILCPAIGDNKYLRAVSLAWNGIGESSKECLEAYSYNKTNSPRPKEDLRGSGGGGLNNNTTGGSKDVSAAGLALINMIRKTTSLTELDASNCRLGARLCLELADAIKTNRYICIMYACVHRLYTVYTVSLTP